MSRPCESSVASNVQHVRTGTHSDAELYVREVKETFRDQNKYQTFINVLKVWLQEKRENRVDFPTVVARVKELFDGHKNLIIGLNTFLLPEDKIPLEDEDDNEEDDAVSSNARRDY